MIEFDQKWLDIIYEEGDESDKPEYIKSPLFKDIYTKDEGQIKKGILQGNAVVAFHSYKGGVGRTLSYHWHVKYLRFMEIKKIINY